jgi:hypothetical protein
VVSDLLSLMLVFTWYSGKLLSIYIYIYYNYWSHCCIIMFYFCCILATSLLHIFGVFFQNVSSTNGRFTYVWDCCLGKQ